MKKGNERRDYRWCLSLPSRALRRLSYYNYLVKEGTGQKYGEYTEAEANSPNPNAARSLREDCGFKTLDDPTAGCMLVQAGSARFRLTGEYVLFTVRDVYYEGMYRFHPKRDCAVLDIGANVGVSSLFFAGMQRVKRVISYEPFTPTYQEFLENIALNPSSGGKITPVNEGVWDSSQSLIADFPASHNTVATLYGPVAARLTEEVTREPIVLKAAVDVVTNALNECSGLDLVMKLDCEGSEYPILQSLDESGLLPRLSLILVEWHLHGPDSLVEILERNGFACLLPGVQKKKAGMLYAFKQAP